MSAASIRRQRKKVDRRTTMKINQLTILGSIMVLALGLGFTAPAFAADDAVETVSQHQTLAGPV